MMSATASMVIAIAKAEVGYLEKKSNSNLDSKTANAGFNNYTKYARDMHKISTVFANPMQWCDCFVDWCFYKAFGSAKAKALLGGWSGYTPTSSGYFKNMKQWYTSPKVGDVIFYKNSQRICHTGLVYKVDSTYVYTIEGNTSSTDDCISNGGACAYKKYKLGYKSTNWSIAGYGRPKYDVVTNTSTSTVKYFKKYTGKSGSIVDALNAVGASSSNFNYRKRIATANGIKSYVGTATQNTKMVTLLKKGKLIKP